MLSRYFKSKDKDDSGTLDREELATALPIMGFYPTDADLDRVFELFGKSTSSKTLMTMPVKI